MKVFLRIVLILMLCTACFPSNAEEITITKYTKCGTHGTAKSLNGKTVIVSVFADEAVCKWDFDSDDIYTYSGCYQYLKIACEWITQQTAAYGVKTEFVWDWLNEPYLYYTCSFSEDMINYDHAADLISWVDDNIPTDFILEHYQTTNILYIFYFDTPDNNDVGCCAFPFHEIDRYTIGYEIINLFAGEFNDKTPPATFAHEILHLYGAPDINKPNDRYNMKQRFINDFHSRYPDDIMAGKHDPKFDHINYTFSPLVAYYVGLTDKCEDVTKWRLRKSDYVLYGR